MDVGSKIDRLSRFAKRGKLDELMDLAYEKGGDTDLFIWLNIARDYGNEEAGHLVESIIDDDVFSKEDISSLFFEIAYWYSTGINVERSQSIADEYMSFVDRLNERAAPYLTVSTSKKEIEKPFMKNLKNIIFNNKRGSYSSNKSSPSGKKIIKDF